MRGRHIGGGVELVRSKRQGGEGGYFSWVERCISNVIVCKGCFATRGAKTNALTLTSRRQAPTPKMRAQKKKPGRGREMRALR